MPVIPDPIADYGMINKIDILQVLTNNTFSNISPLYLNISADREFKSVLPYASGLLLVVIDK